jgi:dipeptidyl aminopeptidase/acylaminoacyl peptidase
MRKSLLILTLFLSIVSFSQQDVVYQKPPKAILDLADVNPPPVAYITNDVKHVVLLSRPAFKSLEELASNELKLAGLRINPVNYNTSRSNYYTGLSIQDITSGKKINVTGMPENVKLEYPSFSPKQNYFSFVIERSEGLELWIVEIKTGQAKKVSGDKVSAVLGWPYEWAPDESYILFRWKERSGPYRDEKPLPGGPVVQEATGTKAQARTYQDLLKNKNDEKKFEHYASCSLVRYNLSGETAQVMPEKMYDEFSFSPDGNYLLCKEIHGPYSYQLQLDKFPSTISVYKPDGKLIKTIADKPLQDKIPQGFDAVETGIRNVSWRKDKPSTLVWCEALDNGDPAVKTEWRDKVFQQDAPFDKEAKPLVTLKNRYAGITWGNDKLAIANDYWWKTRNTRTILIDPNGANENPKVLFDRSSEDLYSDPGNFVTKDNQYNERTLVFDKSGTKLYLQGEGYSPKGNMPFVAEYDLNSGVSKKLWQADGVSTYEMISRVVDIEKKILLTRVESPKVYPNFYLREFGSKSKPKQITFNENPYKSFEGVTKQKIFYKRKDGVDLSATLYLPAGYDKKKDVKLPMLMEAYPTEFKDEKNAGQIKESPHRFISIGYGSPVFWAARGYAVLQNAQFPIIGKGAEEPNDTYISQLVANAEAAIHYGDSLGVVDPKRCAVMGHSYGAFMTANLLAHSNLFAAGIARSGAYNRSLTPFGFQSEERNYWQAQKVYNEMAPFNYADKIKKPLLLIHGEADNNPGTFTLQSERLFQAIKGLGGISRLVLLPYESHGYAAKENVLHMLWEMDSWLEKHVKNVN